LGKINIKKTGFTGYKRIKAGIKSLMPADGLGWLAVAAG
jgi:hypothetical protein